MPNLRIKNRYSYPPVNVTIGARTYPVYNLSEKGIGILTAIAVFTVGDKFSLKIGKIEIEAIVAHVTQIKNLMPYLTGFKFISVSDIDALLNFIIRLGD